MEWTPLTISLTIAYFLAASIDTFDTRLIQAKKAGTLPPDEPTLPLWTIVFTFAMWAIFLVFLYLNWKYALALFVVKFVLKVLPVLETIGNILMSPFKPRYRASRSNCTATNTKPGHKPGCFSSHLELLRLA